MSGVFVSNGMVVNVLTFHSGEQPSWLLHWWLISLDLPLEREELLDGVLGSKFADEDAFSEI